MSFVRRFSDYPGNQVITQIEAVSIIDLTPAGTSLGTGTGTVALVGEFADMTYAVAVSASGAVSTRPRPIEVFSDQDLSAKVGGWDETIGEFGVSCGNGFVEIRGRRFNRLIVVPVNLASAKGARVFRELPTNKSATDPTPITAVQPATVTAGREFKSGANRVRVAARATFTGDLAYVAAIDGVQTSNTGPAATGVFTSATAAFVAAGAAKGDILVLGVIGGAGLPGTYRILSVDSATQITVERMDGATFTWAGVTALPFRLHPRAAADSGAVSAFADVAGYTLPARPLDVTITAGTLLAPAVAAAAGTATAWDPLSGLTLVAMPGGGGGLTYTAAVQAPNAVSAGGLDALYASAIDSLLADSPPANEVDVVWAARKSSAISIKLRTHATTNSAQGKGRAAVISPPLSLATIDAAIAASYPGVGANRNERVFYSWPAVQTFIQEAIGFNVKGSDGINYSDGLIDVTGDSYLDSVLSTLLPERNPGEATANTRRCLATVLGYARNTPTLGIGEYTAMRQGGICGIRIAQGGGPRFQSGITTSLVSGEKNINRRRFADFIEDSLAEILDPFNKLPISTQFVDGVLTQAEGFLSPLKSETNPSAARLNDYLLDPKGGNTDAQLALGIFVLNVRVRMTPTADFIVIPVSVGPGVDTSA